MRLIRAFGPATAKRASDARGTNAFALARRTPSCCIRSMPAKKKPTNKRKKKATAKSSKKNSGSASLTLAELLGGKPASSFDSRKLMGKAHWRWNKDELHEAFLLFDAAAERAGATGDATDERASLNRAAITLFRAKRDPVGARRRLREVIDHYTVHPDDSADRHFVDWAMSSLLEDAADTAPNAAAFAKVYRAGVAEARKLLGEDRFPRIHIERLIDAAKQAGAREIVDELEA